MPGVPGEPQLTRDFDRRTRLIGKRRSVEVSRPAVPPCGMRSVFVRIQCRRVTEQLYATKLRESDGAPARRRGTTVPVAFMGETPMPRSMRFERIRSVQRKKAACSGNAGSTLTAAATGGSVPNRTGGPERILPRPFTPAPAEVGVVLLAQPPRQQFENFRRRARDRFPNPEPQWFQKPCLTLNIPRRGRPRRGMSTVAT